MKNTTKLKIALLMFALIVLTLIVLPNAVNADTKTVTDEASLKDAIKNANSGDVITLNADITLTGNISTNKTITIDGAGHTVKGSNNWEKKDSLFTVTKTGFVTFKDITLTDAPKYGVQAFEGTAIFSGVTIKNCTYGGVLVNGGMILVNELHLGYNGEKANNGIELDQNSSTTYPRLVINGTLTSTESKDVVRASTNANTKEVSVTNTQYSKSKVFVADGKIIVADEKGNVISESTLGKDIEAKVTYNEGVIEKVLLTIVTKNGTVDVALDKGSTVTSDFVKEHLTLAKGDVIDGYYTDKEYSIAFNFDTVINADTSIYVKVSTPSKAVETTTSAAEKAEEEKDDTPKTGAIDMIAYASLLAMISIAGIIKFRK